MDQSLNHLSLFFLFQAAEGPGLAFIMYSEAIKNMPLSQFWSVLYFIMLLLLGMGSMLGNVTAIITPVRDFKVFSRLSNELFNGKINTYLEAMLKTPPVQLLNLMDYIFILAYSYS